MPPQALLDRLDADQRTSFQQLWEKLPPHLRSIKFDLHGPGWTPQVITDLGDLLCEFRDVFSTSSTDLGSCSLLPFKITVPPDSAPVTSKPYRMNPLVAKQVDAILDQYLAAGLIQHSNSPYSSPIVVIPKKSGGIRITVNYRKLNSISTLGQLPIPRVEEILAKLNKGSIFSLFDFTGSFHQITVHKDTIPLTAFATPTRLFEWLRMPMGASQSAGWFVKVINEVIKDLIGVEAYLDDVVKYDANPADHVSSMRAFLERLRHHDLKLSPSKATIGTTKADFLGHTISPEGVLPNAKKVEALTQMPMPRDVKQLRSLMGGLSYYRRFLKNMAKRVRPVTSLLKKGVPFAFTSEMETIVRELLAELAKPPILVFPDWDAVEDGTRPFLLCCDASNDGLGATLEQKQPDNTIKPIVFISRATLDAERNWTPLDLEAGAIVWGVKRLREYLRGTKFCIISDNQALQNMHKISDHNPRVARWIEFLSAYQYTVVHRPGATNGNADMLSRLPIPATEADKTGYSSITSPDDVGVYLIQSSGRSTTRVPHGVGLGGLVPRTPSAALGGLAPIAEDFCDFRKHGVRMRVDDLDAPPGVFVPRAFPSVTTEGPLRHLGQAAQPAVPETRVFAIHSPGYVSSDISCPVHAFSNHNAPAHLSRPAAGTVQIAATEALPVDERPTPQTSGSVLDSQASPPFSQRAAAVDSGTQARNLDAAASPQPPSTTRSRPTRLDPDDLISGRTRRKRAAAAGTPQPDINYGFADDLRIPPRPKRAAATRQPRRTRQMTATAASTDDPATAEPRHTVDAPSVTPAPPTDHIPRTQSSLADSPTQADPPAATAPYR